MEAVLVQLDDTADRINRAQINLKKCPKDRLTRGYIQTVIQNIDGYWQTFKELHNNLLAATTTQQRATLPYYAKDTYGQCEDKHLCLKADLLDLLSRMSSSSSSQSSFVSANSNNNTSAEVKLPRINLPTFSGAYEDWQSFEDTFTSLIENNKALSDVQKLHYLKSCLVGEARNTIKHYQITESNYSLAWDNLKGRYSHKRLIVNAILKRLCSQKKLQTQSSGQLKSLIDNTKECLNSLSSMKIPTDSWDHIIIFLLVQKLDQESHNEWERHVSDIHTDELPLLKDFISFLERRIRTLEVTNATSSKERPIKERSFHASTTEKHCTFCNEDHYLCYCKEFGKLDPEKRNDFVRENRLCYNCLAPGHTVFSCRQKTNCRICKKRHHSLLHQKRQENYLDKEEEKQSPGQSHNNNHISMHTNEERNDTTIASYFTQKKELALLATALVPVRSSTGHTTLLVLRALIDPGSQASFISEKATQLLKPKRMAAHGRVTGVGSTETNISHMVQLEILSRHEREFCLNINAYVLAGHLTSKLPSKTINKQTWPHLSNLNLADPEFFTPGNIDLLLGVEVYTEILKNNMIKGPPGTPTAQETTLGWILFGSIRDNNSPAQIIVMHHHVDIDSMLRNLWEIDMSDKRDLTAEESLCEEIYKKTHTRNEEGRYIVQLPFKSADPISHIGQTKNTAEKRFRQLEKRLEYNTKLKEDYTRVIEEYEQLKHMEEVPENELNKPAVYLPHHAVVREDKETTKTRVVFDASCKGSKNVSLNDELLVGPQLQDDLRSLIMRWRMKQISFAADIRTMYREVLVSEDDVNCQRILWRKHANEDLREYRILRVTFGTASAPYLAVRTLIQLADDESTGLTNKTIREDFYVDDLMSGADTVEEALALSQSVTETLKRGGFALQKWSSNSKDFLSNIEPSLRSQANLDMKGDSITKTLGLTWNNQSDQFEYHFNLPAPPNVITKRSILADVARLYDPLGWLGGAIIPAKILIQKLWLDRLDWDEELNEETKQEWFDMRKEFNNENQIKVKRWINTNSQTLANTTIHGFSDASNKAYAAVAYCRVMNPDGQIETNIIAAKTRVAPVKPVSLPRLELCGAELLAKLLKQIKDAMRIPDHRVFAWTDSTVVLAWLHGDANRWKTFVSNRVVQITKSIPHTQWFHVASKENPADIGSRGLELPQLLESKLWWKGPQWLRCEEIPFTKPTTTQTEEEKRTNIQINLKIDNEERLIQFEDYDSISEVLKTIVYCTKFLNLKREPEKINAQITTEDLEQALTKIIRLVQREQYGEEIEHMKDNKQISMKSNLKSLNPFLDSQNILRVGGRLRHANMEEQSKHPIILASKHGFIKLIVKEAHLKTLHGGVQLMLSYLRTKYWIIKAKPIVKAQIHRCLICARQNAKNRKQLMGDLPKVRVNQARPFLHSGVDFAGPLHILMTKGRGAKTYKAYIAIFICMVTKAIHLELAGDMSSEAFIGAFRRFVARRGRCAHMWSDQGRNFVGANKELVASWEEAKLEMPGHMAELLIADGTQWHFIPPYSPNFGGLWEAGVKSVKGHLRKVLTNTLSFEEMTTLLCEIEACLNSRPLTPIDDTDTDNVDPLTPGHFLMGEPPVAIPNPTLMNLSMNRLSRWQLTQKLLQDFWRRWQSEYLSRLQGRPKWFKREKEFDIGDIVLIKEDNLPPGKWCLGRIIAKHPGPDNITRVYSVKCRDHVLKRCVSKLCALPIDKT